MYLRMLVIIGTAAALRASFALADDSPEPKLSFDGFGTLGVIHSDYEKADFVTSSYFHPRGVGRSRRWGVDQDTRLGLQVTADFTDRLSAVVQVVSELRYDNTFKPNLEWANLKYEITPGLSIRAGRVLLPTYLTSDTQNVGYVNPWVRTPAEILIQLPITNSDGVEMSYQFNVGDTANRLQILYGENKERVIGNVIYENTDIRAIVHTLDYAALTVHAGYQKMRYSYAASNVVDPPKQAVDVFEVAALYDPGSWYIMAEIFKTNDELIGKTEAWYAGGGYRFGSVTPYAFRSRIDQTEFGQLILASLINQRTTGVGLRWDFMKNLAAKLQYERIEIGSDVIPISFVNAQPDFASGDRAHIFSATLDFVW